MTNKDTTGTYQENTGGMACCFRCENCYQHSPNETSKKTGTGTLYKDCAEYWRLQNVTNKDTLKERVEDLRELYIEEQCEEKEDDHTRFAVYENDAEFIADWWIDKIHTLIEQTRKEERQKILELLDVDEADVFKKAERLLS